MRSIPEKEESASTEELHRFVVKGVPSKLHIRLMNDDQPYANTKYKLSVDGTLYSGATDEEGWLVFSIPPGAKSGKLIVDDDQNEYDLELGHLDPIDSVSGLQARLNNLGFDCGKVDDILGPKSIAALQAFQKRQELKITGEADSITLEELENEYGC